MVIQRAGRPVQYIYTNTLTCLVLSCWYLLATGTLGTILGTYCKPQDVQS